MDIAAPCEYPVENKAADFSPEPAHLVDNHRITRETRRVD